MIKDFEATNPKRKYKSDFEVFVRESKLEDFFSSSGETILVSTIHKAKGKEFDNIYLLLDDFDSSTDENKRQAYVAMTRAKRNLTIHLNTDLLKGLYSEGMEIIEDNEIYSSPNDLAMQLSFKDVWLDYFINRQSAVAQLISGENLVLNENECLNAKGQSVLRFSQQFVKQLEHMKERNYELRNAKVNFIVYWLKEGASEEVMIVLPELHFKKMSS
jgi:ATP-dependent DNA helicase RecQ